MYLQQKRAIQSIPMPRCRPVTTHHTDLSLSLSLCLSLYLRSDLDRPPTAFGAPSLVLGQNGKNQYPALLWLSQSARLFSSGRPKHGVASDSSDLKAFGGCHEIDLVSSQLSQNPQRQILFLRGKSINPNSQIHKYTQIQKHKSQSIDPNFLKKPSLRGKSISLKQYKGLLLKQMLTVMNLVEKKTSILFAFQIQLPK